MDTLQNEPFAVGPIEEMVKAILDGSSPLTIKGHPSIEGHLVAVYDARRPSIELLDQSSTREKMTPRLRARGSVEIAIQKLESNGREFYTTLKKKWEKNVPVIHWKRIKN